MDDQNQNKMFMPTQGEDTSTQPPRFHRPHISQEPINDPEPEYVTRNRYQTLEDAQTGRKHMGVASGDPVYLKDAPLSKNSAASDEPMKASATHQQRGPRPKQTLTHSARYLETPKQGKSIFVSSSKRPPPSQFKRTARCRPPVSGALASHGLTPQYSRRDGA